MALAFGAIIYNGVRCKIFTVTMLDNDAPANLAVDLVANGMTALPAVPTEVKSVITASAADAGVRISIASTATICTIRKLTPVGGLGANAKTFRIMLRVPRGIAG